MDLKISFLENLRIPVLRIAFCLYYFLEEKQNSLLKMVLHLLEKWFKNFFELSTFTDPERTTSFPQNYTIYYWAYWMVWCVAAPFFIGNISRGRTVRQTILFEDMYLVLDQQL